MEQPPPPTIPTVALRTRAKEQRNRVVMIVITVLFGLLVVWPIIQVKSGHDVTRRRASGGWRWPLLVIGAVLAVGWLSDSSARADLNLAPYSGPYFLTAGPDGNIWSPSMTVVTSQ